MMVQGCIEGIPSIEIGFHRKAVETIEEKLLVTSSDCTTIGATTDCGDYQWTFTRDTNAISEVRVTRGAETVYWLRCDLAGCHEFDPAKPADTNGQWTLR